MAEMSVNVAQVAMAVGSSCMRVMLEGWHHRDGSLTPRLLSVNQNLLLGEASLVPSLGQQAEYSIKASVFQDSALGLCYGTLYMKKQLTLRIRGGSADCVCSRPGDRCSGQEF